MKLLRFRLFSFRAIRLGPWFQWHQHTWPVWRGGFWQRASRHVELFDAAPARTSNVKPGGDV